MNIRAIILADSQFDSIVAPAAPQQVVPPTRPARNGCLLQSRARVAGSGTTIRGQRDLSWLP